MPIYAYRCEACGFAKDVLQKISDPQLTVCLSCGEERFKKQVTAAGFQLKGTGWYATDFRNGAGTAAPAVAANAGEGEGGAGEKSGSDKGSEKASEKANEKANDRGSKDTAGNDTGSSKGDAAKGGSDKAASSVPGATANKGAGPATSAAGAGSTPSSTS